MSTDVTALTVQARTGTGKGAARATRRAGLVPGVIYGDKQAPTLIAVDPRFLIAEMNRPGFYSRLFELDLDGAKTRTICRDLQRDPVTDAFIHADFQRIGTGAMIHVAVPVHVVNEVGSPGLKRGGVVNVVEHTLEIVGRPETIPNAIEIDLAGLDIGDSVHLHQVKLPEGVKPLHPDQDITVLTIVAPTGMKAEASEAEGEAAGPAPAAG